jgi:predicted metal-dependent TIM-barrel fold hydrolase
MIHTPHRDKKRGTSRSMDVLEEHGLDPSMVVIDHNNEETVKEVLERGYWAAFSIYPSTKMGNARMVEICASTGRADHRRLGLRLGHLRAARRAQDRRLMRERGIPRSTSARSATATRSPPTGRAAR